MSKPFKPLLAATVEDSDLPKLRYPLVGSIKLDGIRALVCPERGAITRTLKAIPNHYIRANLEREFERLGGQCPDGEIGVGDPTDPDFFLRTHSAVMTRSGTPRFTFYLFDTWKNPKESYWARLPKLSTEEDQVLQNSEFIVQLGQTWIHDEVDLLKFEDLALAKGHEGIVLRDPCGAYKFGRSTLKEQILLKRKPFADDEAVVVGLVEQMANLNEATVDELGHTKRSAHQENKLGKGTLGALVVEHSEFGQFQIGGGRGLNNALRQQIWDNPKAYVGKTITFCYQKVGTKDKPRIPKFKCFREGF